MALPGNGVFVVQGEISTLMTAIKRGTRWNTPTYQVLELLMNFRMIKLATDALTQ